MMMATRAVPTKYISVTLLACNGYVKGLKVIITLHSLPWATRICVRTYISLVAVG